MMSAILYTLIPLAAVIIGAVLSVVRRPGPAFVSGMQHRLRALSLQRPLREVLPQIKHGASPVSTLIGGLVGLGVMLLLKVLEGRPRGSVAMLGAVGIDILVDGLVLGLAFLAGEKAGLLLTVALTLEVLFLGLTVTAELVKRSFRDGG
jgi:ZIP family zinc transporter